MKFAIWGTHHLTGFACMAQPWQNAGITATEKGKKELQDG